jgi:tetratricopeptide (TPR) repeat protein
MNESQPLEISLQSEPGIDTTLTDTPDQIIKNIPAPLFPSLPGYEILSELGRGGMGVVYQARQSKLNRLVALKMILSGAPAGPEELARFRKEAETLARLQHPNIVHVYEVGEHAGRPYFVMELVEGGNLEKRLAGLPQPARDAAQLVATLARAMQAAHQRQVIHRDLKPANVLLSGDGTPKITDFGLAKQLDESMGLTSTGAILGTPSYMAPEQTRQAPWSKQELGPVTDVYALGAILYKMLTGRPPFLGETALDTLFQVVSREPVPPRELQPKVPCDLETICLKCLQKEARKRYADAQALADDLQRFLDGKPIHARPVGALERLGRWSRRQPLVAGLAAGILVVLLAGISAVAWAWRRAEANYQLAETRRELAETNFQLADEQRQRAIKAEGDLEISLIDFAREAHKYESDRRASTLTEKAVAILEKLLQENPENRTFRRDLAGAYRNLGDLYQRMRRIPPAETALGQSVRLLKELIHQEPANADYQSDLSDCYHTLGNLYVVTNRLPDGEAAYHKALAVRERLARDHPQIDLYRFRAAATDGALGLVYQGKNQFDQAAQAFLKAIGLREALLRRHPQEADYQRGLVLLYNNLGNLFYIRRNLPAAAIVYVKGLGLGERLVRTSPQVIDFQLDVAAGKLGLANVLDECFLSPFAEKNYREAVNIYQKLADAQPEVLAFTVNQAAVCVNLGEFHGDKGRAKEALPWFDRTIELLTPRWKTAGPHPQMRRLLYKAHRGRADALDRLNRPAEVLTALEQAIRFDDGSFADELQLGRAQCLARLGDHGKAVTEAKSLETRLLGKGAGTGSVLVELSRVYALASTAALQDKKLSPAQGQEVAAQYGKLAVELIRLALLGGYFQQREHRKEVQKGKDFAVLQTREDFQQLVQAWSKADN